MKCRSCAGTELPLTRENLMLEHNEFRDAVGRKGPWRPSSGTARGCQMWPHHPPTGQSCAISPGYQRTTTAEPNPVPDPGADPEAGHDDSAPPPERSGAA